MVCFRLRHLCAGSSRHPAESRSSSCGPRFRFRLLPTSPRGDAVTFRYGAVASSGMDLHHADLTPLWTHTKRPAGGLEEGIVWVLLHSSLAGLTVCISIRKNANSFSVAAVVTPLVHLFFFALFFFYGLYHRGKTWPSQLSLVLIGAEISPRNSVQA